MSSEFRAALERVQDWGFHRPDCQTELEADVALSVAQDIKTLLRAEGQEKGELFGRADQVRREVFGDEVHFRGIIEFSNYCYRNCYYCGLRYNNRQLSRYRLDPEEILEVAQRGAALGFKTIVLQSGEDFWYRREIIGEVVRCIKHDLGLAVTLSLGNRSYEDYAHWRAAGADRYLLKHETADAELFRQLRPNTSLADRLQHLHWLRELGYQVGAGNIVGLPGQTLDTLAQDLLLMWQLDAEMAGIGPFIPHPDTPLGESPAGSVEMTLKVLAVARLLLPLTHLPATTALATLHPEGRVRALACGANVIMPNIMPRKYRPDYAIYPGKAGIAQEPEESWQELLQLLARCGRKLAWGYGHSPKAGFGGDLQAPTRGYAQAVD